MGWTSFSMHEPIKEWFTRAYQDDKREVLDVALVKRNTLYAAVKINETQQVICYVFLIRWSRDAYNFSYKDMTEFSGPCEYECPKRIMKLLTPLTDTDDPNSYARNWRKDVEEHWKNQELLNSKDVCFKTSKPVTFNSGRDYQYFKKINRRMFAGWLDNGIFKASCRVRVNLSHFNTEPIKC